MSEVSATSDRERFIGGYSGRMLAVIALAWGTLQTARFVLPPLLPEIRADLNLTLTQVGIVLTALQGVYGLSQYPGGQLSDTGTRTTLIVPAMAVLVLGCLLIGSATDFLLLLLGTVVFGVGKGFFAIPSRALLSDLFVENRGRALGVYGATSDIGGALASSVAVVVIAFAAWRAVFLPLSIVMILLLILFALWTRESYVVHSVNFDIFNTIRRLVATPNHRWTLLAYTLFYFTINGVLTFLPAYLREIKMFSPELASMSFAVLFVIGIGVKPVSGAISDRIPRQLIGVAGMLLSAVTFGLLLVVESMVGIFVLISLFAIGFKGQLPVIDAVLIDAAPVGKVGSDLGAARTLFLGVGSLGPAYVGLITDMYDYTSAFAFLVACLVVAGAILAWQAQQ